MKKVTALLLLFIMLLTPVTISMGMDYGDYLNNSVEFMQDMYYLHMDDDEALKAALKGIFGNLDLYTGFFDNDETELLNQNLNGNFVGIGATLEKCDEGVRITKVYEDSPAEKAGLCDGDIILAVDGISTAGKEADAVASEIRGEEGTEVTLTIQRQSDKMDVTVKRGVVVISPVSWRIEGDVAYICIESFNNSAVDKFNRAMDEIERSGITKILLDLRDNSGGLVDAAVSIAQRIVPKGLITKLDFKSERLEDEAYYSDLKDSPYLIAVLVNENTASAAEILAGAIQDAGNGVLVGKKTYGKGIVQNMFYVLTPEVYAKYNKQYGVKYLTTIEWLVYYGIMPDPDEILGTVKITTGYYLTRNGRKIHGVGLTPDVEVADRTLPNGIDLMQVSALSNAGTLTPGTYDGNVYQAERILKAAGYFKGVPDRRMDQETQEAVKAFQTASNIPASGNIDAATRDKLNALLDALRNQNDQQYVKGMEILKMF